MGGVQWASVVHSSSCHTTSAGVGQEASRGVSLQGLVELISNVSNRLIDDSHPSSSCVLVFLRN